MSKAVLVLEYITLSLPNFNTRTHSSELFVYSFCRFIKQNLTEYLVPDSLRSLFIPLLDGKHFITIKYGELLIQEWPPRMSCLGLLPRRFAEITAVDGNEQEKRGRKQNKLQK